MHATTLPNYHIHFNNYSKQRVAVNTAFWRLNVQVGIFSLFVDIDPTIDVLYVTTHI